MVRIFGVLGFTGGFLLISQDLRQTVMDGVRFSDTFLQNHSPYSYLGVGILIFGGLMLTLFPGHKAR